MTHISDTASPQSAPPKLSQLAHRRFKEALFDRRIRTGAVLSQAELALIVGVPVGPLREALQVLESEGLLTVMPRSGIRICKPDFELVKHSYQLRRILEREAVARFVEQVDGATLDRLEEGHRALLARATDDVEAPELFATATAVDHGMHQAMIGRLRNPIISDVYAHTYMQICLIRLDRDYALSPLLIRRTMEEHLAVLAAVRRRDAEAAAAAMDEHLTRSMHRAMGL